MFSGSQTTLDRIDIDRALEPLLARQDDQHTTDHVRQVPTLGPLHIWRLRQDQDHHHEEGGEDSQASPV